MAEMKVKKQKGSNYDKEFIKLTIKLAEKCLDRWNNYYPFHSAWLIHIKSILKYIMKFQKKTNFNLTNKEKTVLIASAILHDIGKILPSLHPSIAERDAKETPSPQSLAQLQDAHHILTFLLLRHIFSDKLRKKLLERKHYITSLNIDLGDTANEAFVNLAVTSEGDNEYVKYLQCVAWISLQHKIITDELLNEFKYELLGERYSDSGTASIEDETDEKDKLLQFKDLEKNSDIIEINNWLRGNEDRNNNKIKESVTKFEFLSALFQLGDKLDISEERINQDRFIFAVLLDDIGLPYKQVKFPHPDAMARWYQFWYTKEPKLEIESRDTSSVENSYSGKSSTPYLKLTIPYRYPECIREDFPYFRYQAEKDFEDLHILFVLQKAIQEQKKDEDYRVIIKRTENSPEGKPDGGLPMRIRGLMQRNERLLYCLRKVCKACKDKDEYRTFVETGINNYLYIPHGEFKKRKAFPCKSEPLVEESLNKCLLLYLVEKSFDSDNELVSYRDWRDLAIRKLKNVRHVLCNNWNKEPKTEDEEKMVRYLKAIEDDNVMLSLSNQAKEGVENWKKKIEMERSTFPQGALFYPAGSSRYIPISMDVAYLLNLFRHFRGESLSIEHIANITGLDRRRILLYCGRMEHEGFLQLDDQAETYKLNPGKYLEVEKALKHFDYRRAELVSKVRDIKRFGKPLALCADHNETKLDTRINGLDMILAPHHKELRGLPLRKSILLLGPPGAGKTTLALEIVRQVRMKRLPVETALFLTFEEDIQRLMENYESFGWSNDEMESCVRSLCTLHRSAYLNNPEEFLKHFLNILDEFAPDLVAVDNLGYFLQLVPSEVSREVLNRLIRVFAVRGITSLLVGENISGYLGFEAYDVDGVIYLGESERGRWLEISKLRGREFASGKHPFKICDTRKTKRREDPIIQVFPNIKMHIDIEEDQGDKEESMHVLSSGIKGLDDLLPIFPLDKGKESGFQKGEAILVLGSPGAGKTLLGLHFLKEGYKPKESNEEKKDRILWVSFESDETGLFLATRSFNEKAGFKQMINDMKDGEKKKAQFKFYPPAQLEPDELVNFLLEECGKGVKRLVIDSVTDLEQVFPQDIDFKAFMTSLVHLLRKKKVTTMFLYRSKGFFGKTEDIGRVLASVVDTIICLKVLEIQNAIQKGVFLLKVRGREHLSKLLSVDFREDEGVIVTDRGWTMSGLISGEAGEIREPRVSVKLFFENRNERLINSLIVKEYNRRFEGGQTTFVHVRKPQIYSEFWSFRGSSGAGHANVRVVSLCDYWAILFHNQGKLYNLWEYVSAGTRQIIRKEEFWRRCATYSHKDHAFKIFSVPNYVDVGILAFHEKIESLKEFWTYIYNKKNSIPADRKAVREKLSRLTWNMLDPTNNTNLNKLVDYIERDFINKKKIKDQEKASGDKNENAIPGNESPPRYLFAMPSLFDTSAFVSFFLELYWSFGGVVFDFREEFNNYADNCRKKYRQERENSLMNTSSQDTAGKQPGDESSKEFPESEKFPSLYKFPYKSSGNSRSRMSFIAEILTLIPERILNFAIQYMNETRPNFIGDICRYGEVLLQKLLDEKGLPHTVRERESGVGDIENPLGEFIKIYSNDEIEKCPINIFIKKLGERFKWDNIWKGQEELINALEKVGQLIKAIVVKEGDLSEQNDLLLILFSVVSRIITDRERYVFLLNWIYKTKSKNNDDMTIYLNEIINIREECPYAYKTLEFLFQLVNSGIAPNPYKGDFTRQAYLARKWSGDISPEPILPRSEKIIDPLALYSPTEAFELDENDEMEWKVGSEYETRASIRWCPFGIVPLPSYDRGKTNNIESNIPNVPEGKWCYAVLGLWSLGITSPAVSPEIGWIFIDALTENKFVGMRARRGLGLPAKVSAYNNAEICEAQPDIYGVFNKNGKLMKDEKGIVQFYQIATQDIPQFESQESRENTVDEEFHYRTRERASIPYYYKIEEILSKELERFFNPSFFDILTDYDKRDVLIKKILHRINNRIRNFLKETLEKEDTR